MWSSDFWPILCTSTPLPPPTPSNFLIFPASPMVPDSLIPLLFLADEEPNVTGEASDESSDESSSDESTNEEDRKEPEASKPYKNPELVFERKYGPGGQRSYPDHPGPTVADCRRVHAALKGLHSRMKRPPIEKPTRKIAGCGEELFVLDSTVRTIVSADVSMPAANAAVQNMVDQYGWIATDPLAQVMDFNSIWVGSRADLARAIEPAGIENRKAEWIKMLLEDEYADNVAERDRLLAEGIVPNLSVDPYKKSLSNDARRAAMVEVARWTLLSTDVLTLDYLHKWEPREVFRKLLGFRGVNAKSAACVMLFCFRRPFFAVGTHCERLCQWLGLLPVVIKKSKLTEAFYHLDPLVPDNLKYALHQLLIDHGKYCVRCDAKSTTSHSQWDEWYCSLEQFLTRIGVEKGGVDTEYMLEKKTPKAAAADERKRKREEEEEQKNKKQKTKGPPKKERKPLGEITIRNMG